MMEASYLEGLTDQWRQQARATATVDLTKLRPADVTRVVNERPWDLDWSAVLFIKNFRTPHQLADTVVWTKNEGFFRTSASANKLLTKLCTLSAVNWSDLDLELERCRLSGPTPFVDGDLQLITTERPASANNTSWVNGQHIKHIVAGPRRGTVRVLIDDGVSLIFQDTPPRLRKKLQEAQQLQDFQQRLWQFMQAKHGGKDLRESSFGRDVREFADYRDLMLCWQVVRKANIPMGLAEIEAILRDLAQRDAHPWHLTDDR